MATAVSYEPFRLLNIPFTFTGAVGFGANGSDLTLGLAPYLDEGEYVYEVFYRITTPLTSGDTAGTYLQLGIGVDDNDCIFNSTTGIVDTLNATTTGVKIEPAYTKSTIDGRLVSGTAGGTNDITGGTIEILLTIARAQISVDFVDTFI